MNVITNAQKYQAMREALNEFYWDNGISPLGTAAMLDTFAGEVNRLAQFVRDNSKDLDRAAEQRDAPVHAEQNGAEYCTCEVTPRINGLCLTCGLPRAPHSNRSAGG